LEGFTKCEVIKYDVDDMDESLLEKYKVRNVPVTVLVDEKGNEVQKWVGLFDIKELETKLDDLGNG
jgi:thioredoxin-related protein